MQLGVEVHDRYPDDTKALSTRLASLEIPHNRGVAQRCLPVGQRFHSAFTLAIANGLDRRFVNGSCVIFDRSRIA